jgi:CspA family cold shock protein
MNMTEGTIKFFDPGKHFGFINGDDGKSYYFHESQVDGHVADDDRVSFTPAQGDRGPKAEHVKKLSKAPDSGLEPADSEETEANEEELESEVAEAEEETGEAEEEAAA